MQVRLKTLMAGPDAVVHPGQVAEMPRDQAYALIEAGYAEQLGGETVAVAAAAAPAPASTPQTAALQPTETAAHKPARPRGAKK